jgi:hypothetical protein
MSTDATSTADLACFLADARKNSRDHIRQPRLSILQQVDHASEPVAVEVSSFLEDVSKTRQRQSTKGSERTFRGFYRKRRRNSTRLWKIRRRRMRRSVGVMQINWHG